jgi:predicted phosphodiesterase
LFFNPGSASGKFPAMRKTYGILTIEESIDWRVVTID